MNLDIQHIEVHVSSIEEAKEFYLDKLQLEMLDDMPELNLFAVKAGNIRISFFGGYDKKTADNTKVCGSHIIFRVDNLEKAIIELKSRGISFTGGIVEVGGFIRDIATKDPDGNTIEFAEYLRDPLSKSQ